MTLLEKNVLIAKWFGWIECTSPYYHSFAYSKLRDPYPFLQWDGSIAGYLVKDGKKCSDEWYNQVRVEGMRFNSDTSWQWLCVKKIAEIEGISVLRAYWLLESFYPFVEPVMELEQIFEAIVNYVQRNTPTHEHIQN